MTTAPTFPRRAASLVNEAMSDTPIVAVNGPRQVGKSTLARQLAGERGGLLLTLDDQAQRRAASDDPRGFVERDGRKGPLVIDEVQFVPELFRALKAAVDRDRRPGRFVVTGSARLLSTSGFADPFVGRIELIDLWPLSQGELDDAPDGFVDWAFGSAPATTTVGTLSRRDIVERLSRGGFPEAVQRDGRRRARWFESYVVTLTEKIVRQVSAIERSAELPRVLRLCAARSGEELNVTSLANTVGIPARTLDGYVAQLANLFAVQLIPAWSTNLSKKVVRRPKIVVVDSGLACHLTGLHASRADDPTVPIGPLLESFVAMELRKQLSWSAESVSLAHFRDRDGAEVDLVLEHADGRVIGIEVKAARSVSSRDTTGLRFLADRLGHRFHAGFVLSAMPEPTPLGERITALPIESLWRTPAPCDDA